jgi:dTDP-4-dehydrorhamnose reductase
MDRPLAVIGANGQLGSDLMRLWPGNGVEYRLCGLTHADVEVTDIASLRSALSPLSPRIVINTSAFHRVDDIESDPERAFRINTLGARNLAVVCRELDAVLVHLSTDYVFSGRKGSPYTEADPVDPVNLYGVSKVAGELAIRAVWGRHFIVRSSGLYGLAGPSGKGSNFVELMLRLAESGKPIRVVNDQTLTPTPTAALAQQIAALCGCTEYGTYHATCQGGCTWFEFARAIFETAGVAPDLSPQSTAQSGAKATRPSFSVLQNRNLVLEGIDLLPHWRVGLQQYIEARPQAIAAASLTTAG